MNQPLFRTWKVICSRDLRVVKTGVFQSQQQQQMQLVKKKQFFTMYKLVNCPKKTHIPYRFNPRLCKMYYSFKCFKYRHSITKPRNAVLTFVIQSRRLLHFTPKFIPFGWMFSCNHLLIDSHLQALYGLMYSGVWINYLNIYHFITPLLATRYTDILGGFT